MKADNSKGIKAEIANNNMLIAGMTENNELLKKIINKTDEIKQEINTINEKNKNTMRELNEIKNEMQAFLKMDATETNNYFKEEMQKVKNSPNDRNSDCEKSNDIEAFEKYFGR